MHCIDDDVVVKRNLEVMAELEENIARVGSCPKNAI